jgi:hypothetical protein
MKRHFFAALFACLCLACCLNAGDDTNPRELDATELKAVQELGEKALKDRGLWKGKVYLTNTEVVLDSGKTPERFAILTYYRYEGNLGIVMTINVAKRTMVNVQEHPNMPTSLTPEEIAEAEKIARADPNVKKALAPYQHLDRIEVDTCVAYIIDPGVPGYHHRVARLLFRDAQRQYLPRVPIVDVDLTTGAVRLDLFAGPHDKK